MFCILGQSLRIHSIPIVVQGIERSLPLFRAFSIKESYQKPTNPFIDVPEDKIRIDINRYKAVGRDALPNDITSRVRVTFNVNEADWMPENIKQIFMQQQASHIDENGNFCLISSLHRSIVANKLEIMRKLQKKVNQACISTKDQHSIGYVDPLNNEKRLKEKHKRSEKSRKRRGVSEVNVDEFF